MLLVEDDHAEIGNRREQGRPGPDGDPGSPERSRSHSTSLTRRHAAVDRSNQSRKPTDKALADWGVGLISGTNTIADWPRATASSITHM